MDQQHVSIIFPMEPQLFWFRHPGAPGAHQGGEKKIRLWHQVLQPMAKAMIPPEF